MRIARRLAFATSLHLLEWLATGAEAWLALRLMDVPYRSLPQPVSKALLYAVRSVAFMVPMAAGVQEGGYLVVGAAFGLPPDQALALSLLKRGRDVALGVPALLGWQALEGGQWWRRRRAAPRQGESPERGEGGRGLGTSNVRKHLRAKGAAPWNSAQTKQRSRRRGIGTPPLLLRAADWLSDIGGISAPALGGGRRADRDGAAPHRAQRFRRMAIHRAAARSASGLRERGRARRLRPFRVALGCAAVSREFAAASRRRESSNGAPRRRSSGRSSSPACRAAAPPSCTICWSRIRTTPCRAAGRRSTRRSPAMPRARRARIRKVDRQLKLFRCLAPDFGAMHPITATAPQECSEITAHVFASLRFDTTHHVPSYRAWLDNAGHLRSLSLPSPLPGASRSSRQSGRSAGC